MAVRKLSIKSREDREPKGFRVIKDPAELQSLLSWAADHFAKVSFQVKGSGHQQDARFDGWVAGLEESELRIEGLDERRLAEFYEAIHQSQAGQARRAAAKVDCLLLLFLEGQAVLAIEGAFVPEKVKPPHQQLVFILPERAFKFQRRRHSRYVIPKAYEMTIELDHPDEPQNRTRRKLLDISGTGLSFRVISPREALHYRPGRALGRVTFTLLGRRITVDAEVRNVVPMHENVRKVGIRFTRLTTEDADYIASFVLAHAFRTVAG